MVCVENTAFSHSIVCPPYKKGYSHFVVVLVRLKTPETWGFKAGNSREPFLSPFWVMVLFGLMFLPVSERRDSHP